MDKIPIHLLKYGIAHARHCYTECATANVLSQVIAGNGYTFGYHRINCASAMQITCERSSDCTTIIIDIKNRSASCMSPDSLDLEAGTTSFACVDYDTSMFDVNVLQSTVNTTPRLMQCIEEIVLCDHQPVCRSLLVDARVRDILRIFLNAQQVDGNVKQMSDAHERLMCRVEAYINAHLDEPLGVEQLARRFHISRSWLQHVCHQHRGKGIHALITGIRLTEAARLLSTTDVPVSTVASKTSDMNFASFSAAFKNYFRMTPSEYRRQSTTSK